jgi:hypothetical protein
MKGNQVKRNEIATRILRTTPVAYARTIGVLYALLFFLGPAAFFYGRTSVYVPGDPAATIEALMAGGSTFRTGMVAETAIVIIEIVTSAMLYVLFRPVNRALSLASTFARFGQAMLQAVNLLTAVPALLLLGGAGYLTAFAPDQLNALVLLFMDVNAFVIIIWGLIFGVHLVLMGYLVLRSGFLPKFLGILLLIGAAGYLLQSYGHILAPQLDATLAMVVLVMTIPSELAFTLWLLLKGVNAERWEERALEAG